MQATELQAGPELDRAVAEACGVMYEYPSHDYSDYDTRVCPRCGQLTPIGEDEVCYPFSPSTDWNDAMLAAERTVAIDDYCSIQLSQCERGDGWTCTIQCDATRAFAETGPLAVCRAILSYRDWMNEKVANEARAVEIDRMLDPLTYVRFPEKDKPMSELATQVRKIILDLKPEALVCNQSTWDAFIQECPPIFNTGEKSIDGVPVHVAEDCYPSGFLAAWDVEQASHGLIRFRAKVAGITT